METGDNLDLTTSLRSRTRQSSRNRGGKSQKENPSAPNTVIVDDVEKMKSLPSNQRLDNDRLSPSIPFISAIGDNDDSNSCNHLRPQVPSHLETMTLQQRQQQQRQIQQILIRRRRWKKVSKRDYPFSSDYPLMKCLPPCDPPPFPDPILDHCTRYLTYIRDRHGTLKLHKDDILVRTTNTRSSGIVGYPMTFRDALSIDLASRGDGADDCVQNNTTGINEYNRAYSIIGGDNSENERGTSCTYRGIVLLRSIPQNDWKMTSEECTIHRVSWENMKNKRRGNNKSSISQIRSNVQTIRNECAVMQYLKNYFVKYPPSPTSTSDMSNVVSTELRLIYETNIMLPLDILYDRHHLYIIKPSFEGADKLLIRCKKKSSDEEECRFLLAQILDGVEWLRRAGVCHQSITLDDIMIVGNGNDVDDIGEGRTIAIGNLEMCIRIPCQNTSAANEGILNVDVTANEKLTSPPSVVLSSKNDEEARIMTSEQLFSISDPEQVTSDHNFRRQCRLITAQPICGQIPLHYVSPEVYNKQPFSAYTVDLWAVGIILFTILTSHKPWEKPHVLDKAFRRITQGDITAILRDDSKIVGLSENAIDILQKMLALDPVDRLSLDQVRSHSWMCTIGPLETLGYLHDHLKSFTVSLDDDTLTKTITSNDGDKCPIDHESRGRMKLMEEQTKLGQEYLWNENELGWNDQSNMTINYSGKLMNNTTVSSKVFDAIISGTIKELNTNISNSGCGKRKRYYQTKDLDASSMKRLRSCLCIHEKENAQSTKTDNILYDCEKDESQSSGHRRLTRGMVRNTKKKIKEKWESRETSCFDALISAMIEIEERGRRRSSRENKNKLGNELNSTQKKLPISLSSKKSQSKETTKSTSKKRQLQEMLKVQTVTHDRAEPLTRKIRRTEEHISADNIDLIAEVPTGRKEDGRRSSRRINILNNITKTVRVRLNIGEKLYELADLNADPRKDLCLVPDISITTKDSRCEEREHTNRDGSPSQRGLKRVHNIVLNENIRKGSSLKNSSKNHTLSEDSDPLLQYLTVDSGVQVPISLNLFDWRRRQQMVPEKESYYTRKKKKKASTTTRDKTKNQGMAQYLLSADIDTTLLSWEAVRSHDTIQAQSVSLKPPRKKYGYETYGLWCSRLINCLQEKGREMARHEFFYSDIDKAWFNCSEFHKELAVMGVPHNAMLTRSEWSLVRSRMKNRPRRFSRKFIQSQYGQLQNYRQLVRKIQSNSASEELKRNFLYEVLSPIKVGATVTAYNKKAKMLHRGTVLTHDENTYLVQFERKDLGCEYCPDYEVAGHGIPEILKPACDIAIGMPTVANQNTIPERYGSLPYGTSYGPLVDFNSDMSRVGAVRDVSRADRSIVQKRHSNIPSPSKGKPGHKDKVFNNALLPKEDIYEKIAERETLVKLISTMTIVLKRKDMIMKAIEAMHAKLRKAKLGHDTQDVLSDNRWHIFKDYYKLLQVNLQLNEEVLESALVYLQVMYGKAYTGDHIISPPMPSSRLNLKFQADHPSDIGNNWASSLLSGSLKVGLAIVQQTETKAGDISFKSFIKKPSGCRKQIIKHRIALALGLLKTADCIGAIGNDKHGSIANAVHPDYHTVNNILHSVTEMLQPIKIPHLPQNVMNILPSSDSGFKALSDAVEMLLIEIAVSG